jgi:hypothetical protein
MAAKGRHSLDQDDDHLALIPNGHEGRAATGDQ